MNFILYSALLIKILIFASIVSIIGLTLVFFIQKKGYLKYKAVNFLMLLCAFGFFIGVLFIFYEAYRIHNYNVGQFIAEADNSTTATTTTIATEATEAAEATEVAVDGAASIQDDAIRYTENTTFTSNSFNYTKDDVDTFVELRQYRNNLVGYSNYLIKSAQDFNPKDYSYENLLKENIIEQLNNQEETQELWNKVLNNIFNYDKTTDRFLSENYHAVGNLNLNEYPNTDVTNNSIDYVESIGISEFWQRKLFHPENRDTETILQNWNKSKAYIFTFLSKSKYDQLCKEVVNDLITIKEEINRQPDYKEFYNTYNVSDSLFLTYPSVDYVYSFKTSQTWLFGFWDRRYHENNDETVFDILKEIQNHYNN
ncbi:MAG: hypothetical protein ACK5MZ_10395 [Aestuariibaculum sp.]